MKRCLLLLALFPLSALAAELVGTVVHVQDGDTLTILVGEQEHKVRLLDIDAPERRQPFYQRSGQSLANMCAGQVAKVTWRTKDGYKRILGRVTCSGVVANAEQIRLGMAWVFVKYAPRDSPLYQEEAAARANKIGLWSDPDPVAPWDWRRKKWEASQQNKR